MRPLEAISRACSHIESVGIHAGLPVIVCPVFKVMALRSLSVPQSLLQSF